MIDFLIRKSKEILSESESFSIGKSEFDTVETVGDTRLFLPDRTRFQRVECPDRTVLIIGDIIGVPARGELTDKEPENFLKDYPGFYYLVILSAGEVAVYSSLFGILPVYYSHANGEVMVSSRAGFIKSRLRERVNPNKQWILERILFNHSLDSETPWEKIRQLPVHHSLLIHNGKVSSEKYLAIEDCFTDRPKPWRQSLGPMAELFSIRCRHYFTDDANRISFTGGFDGRTLLACALGNQVPVKTYSFGSSRNPDITIPSGISKKLGISYTPFYLDQPDYLDEWLSMGQEMVDRCDGNTSFLHVHYLYSSRKQRGKEYLITGMFGSELLRALHVSGQVTSRPLVDFFIHDDPEVWRGMIRDSQRLDYLRLEDFQEELETLWGKLSKLKDESRGLGLSRNQCFYKFIFEETFRKVFGNFIVPQMHYAPVRAPYLDFAFIRELLQTGLAGANNEFFTHNPVKRAKGQVLYARIIQQNYSPLSGELNDKGYRPSALLSPFGKFSIGWGWAGKRLKRRFHPADYDNLGILSAMNKYRPFFERLDLPNYFNIVNIREILADTSWCYDILQRDNLLRSLSLAWYLDKDSM